MASKGIRIPVARHVYLRTQQRRLRHVRSILIRNLTLSEFDHNDPISISVYFTLHSIHNRNKALYRSEPVHESYNPSWESVQFLPQQLGKYTSLGSFLIRLWVKTEGEYRLALEKTVELFDLAYLGSFVNKDGSGYPSNSIIICMFEGYYSHPSVGGVTCPPRVSHSLNDFLPPQSLLEVQRTEVRDSYFYPVLMRILNRQEVLNRTSRAARGSKTEMEMYMGLEKAFFDKRREREQLRTRLGLLREQLAEQETRVQGENEHLLQLKEELDAKESGLRCRQKELEGLRTKFVADYTEHCKRKDLLARTKRNQQLRQRNMIYEVAVAFFIREVNDSYTVCNVILPNADQLEQQSNYDQLGVALGYVAQLVYQLGRILLIPLQYPIKPHGSKSSICDFISDEALIDNIKEFPLFAKGSEKALFQYAVYLLNKDIAQIRQHCGYGTSRSMFKKTLPNLKLLLDRLTKDVVVPQRMDTMSLRSSLPIDASALSSLMSADTISLASVTSSMAATTVSTQSPGQENITPPMSFRSTTSTPYPHNIPYQRFSMDLFENGPDLSHPQDETSMNPEMFRSLQLPSMPASSINAEAEDVEVLDSAHICSHEDTLIEVPYEEGPMSTSDSTGHPRLSAGSDTEIETEAAVATEAALGQHSKGAVPHSSIEMTSQREPFGFEERTTLPGDHTREETSDSSCQRLQEFSDKVQLEDRVLGSESTLELELKPGLGPGRPECPEPFSRPSDITIIPEEIALRLSRKGDGQVLSSEHDHPSVPSFYPNARRVPYTPFGHIGEGGFIKTGVATPHIIGGGGSADEMNRQVHVQVQSPESEAQFLEDFIDSPFNQLRPELRVLTDEELENL